MCNMVLNEELNGVELYFEDKPEQEILNNLKSNGFRWSGYKSCWYAKQNDKTLKLAEQMSQGKEITAEQTKTKKKTKKEVLPLWERTIFTPGNTDKSQYNYKFVGSNYTGLNTKETAKIIRQHLKKRFPEVKFSVRSSHNRIDIEIKQSPYNNIKLEGNLAPWQYKEFVEENCPELEAIAQYCKKLVTSYNFDDSDSMTDYFFCHFYDSVKVNYDYIQTEQTEEIKADIEDFRQKLEQQKKEEEKKKEREYQEHLKQIELDKIEHEKREKEEARQREIINNSIDVKPLEESNQYFVIGSQFAKLNKNNTLNEYKEEVSKGEYYLENVKITKEIHFKTEEALSYFSNMLLHDFDFLEQTGGSYTDDVRINSMTDYHNMDKEERETVVWNLYGVAIYHNNELQFIVDAQGYSYSRYIGLVDNIKIEKELNTKQFVNPAQIEELKQKAELLTDVSIDIITENNLLNTWNNENWSEYKDLMKEQLKQHNIKLSKAIIQQIDGDMESLKVAMYRLLTEVDSIQEQFKNVNLQQGQKLTLFYMSDFGSIVTNNIIFEEVENTNYAQYDNAVKLTFKQKGKRGLFYTHFYSTLLVYEGWLELPETVLNEVEQKDGFVLTKSKYLSCDKKQYDEILNYYYFASNGIRPIINTYKPQF